MTKILIKQDASGVYAVYSDDPNVEVNVTHDGTLLKQIFENGVSAADFAATQHKVW